MSGPRPSRDNDPFNPRSNLAQYDTDNASIASSDRGRYFDDGESFFFSTSGRTLAEPGEIRPRFSLSPQRALITFPAARRRDGDTDSDGGHLGSLRAPRYGGRTDSVQSSGTYQDYGVAGAGEPYPAWTPERQIPLSKE